MKGHLILPSVLWVVAGLCIGIVETRADIFIFTDDIGTPHFTDVPSDSRYRLFIHAEQSDTHVDAPHTSPPDNFRNR
jgi:hypothetical protein